MSSEKAAENLLKDTEAGFSLSWAIGISDARELAQDYLALQAQVATLTQERNNIHNGFLKESEWREEAEAQNKKLMGALEFYADKSNWDTDSWGVFVKFDFDYGEPWKTAQAALDADTSKEDMVRFPLSHKGCDAFWTYWNENGETHKHGYYESTWGAIRAYLDKAAEKPDTTRTD